MRPKTTSGGFPRFRLEATRKNKVLIFDFVRALRVRVKAHRGDVSKGFESAFEGASKER